MIGASVLEKGGVGMSQPLPPQRDAFDLPDGVAYLNCAFMAPQLRRVSEVGIAAVQRKQRRGGSVRRISSTTWSVYAGCSHN